ncbi:MAG: type IV pilus twitching motility protein PilT [Leptolyngbyaceae cyanobacterium bins.349]|nr:type IV pilus twitching motility protein PilT [Leptolyngbyaceae cyanobacterium bins.349]
MTESSRPSAPLPSRVPPAPPPPRAANPTKIATANGATIAATQQMTSPMQPTAASHVGAPTMISTSNANATAIAQPTMVAPSSSAPPAPPAGHRPVPPPATPATRRSATPTNGSPTLAEIVRVAYDKGYSDVHLGVGEVPRYRDRGEISPTEWPETDRETFMSWLQEILSDEEIRRFEEHLEFDGATQYDFARVRINIFDSLHGPAMVLRLIPMKILTIEQLNLPPVFKDVCHYHKGLILITGPTGSGKSTTMAAMVDYMNKEMPKHIITIEDPIEFVHRSKKALIKHREVGINTRKFENALKASLREDPDVILVGEMRDKETVNTALKAAQTGHLVMGTLHTNSAVKTIERILQLYEPDQQAPIRVSLAESMIAVIAQGLCRTTDGKRAAFHDILINTDAIKDYIRRGDLDEVEALIPRCTFDGMCTMNQSLYKLYEAGRITEETALEMSPKPNEMAQMLRGRV